MIIFIIIILLQGLLYFRMTSNLKINIVVVRKFTTGKTERKGSRRLGQLNVIDLTDNS